MRKNAHPRIEIYFSEQAEVDAHKALAKQLDMSYSALVRASVEAFVSSKNGGK